MRAKLICALALIGQVFSALAHAQAAASASAHPCDALAKEMRSVEHPEGFSPHVVASLAVSVMRDCRIVSFYRYPAEPLPFVLPDGMSQEAFDEMPAREKRARGLLTAEYDLTPRFAAGLLLMDNHMNVLEQDNTPFWLDQNSCPAILTALEDLEQTIGKGLAGGPARPNVIILDGDSSTLWVHDQLGSPHRARFEIDGNGNEISRWMGRTLPALQSCIAPIAEPSD